MFGGRRSLTSLDLLRYAHTTQCATRLGRPILHALVGFIVAKLLLTNYKITANTLTKQIRDFAFKHQNIFQKSFNTFVHWFPHFAACCERWGRGIGQ